MGAGQPAARGVARPKGGDAGGPGTPLAVGACCAGAVGSSLADPLYATGPPGVPHALGTQFIGHVVEECIRVWYAHAKARATLLKARAARWRGDCRSYACTSKRREKWYNGSSWSEDGRQGEVLTRSSRLPLSPPINKHTNTRCAHNTHSPARLPLPVGRHPGLCLLVTAPSAQHNTTQHNTKESQAQEENQHHWYVPLPGVHRRGEQQRVQRQHRPVHFHHRLQ